MIICYFLYFFSKKINLSKNIVDAKEASSFYLTGKNRFITEVIANSG